MGNKDQKKSVDKVFKKKEKIEKEETEETEETKEEEKQSARLAERKGQRPAFPFNRKNFNFLQ